MKITWDEPKRLANLAKHGLDFQAVSAEFFESAYAAPARGGRAKFVGILNGVLAVAVIAAPLGGEAISIISLRPANRKERRIMHAQS